MSAGAFPGSYDADTYMLGGISEESARLEQQAELSWHDEARVLGELGLDTADTLVEVGCGPGAITRRLQQWRGRTGVVAIDHDVRLLGPTRDVGAQTVAAAAQQLPLRDSCADAVLLRYVLQHVPDPDVVLAEARRVLRPGGRVVIIDVDAQLWGVVEPPIPGLDGLHHVLAAAQARQGGDRLIARKLPRLLAGAGFADVRVMPFATNSSERGVDAFEVHLGPQRMLPLIRSGDLTVRDLAVATAGWQRFRADPNSWVLLLGLAVSACVPGA